MTDPITPDERADIRRQAVEGYSLWPYEVLRLLDALDTAEAKTERQRDRLRAREEQVRRLRAEVTRLHALVADLRTAPVWDEDTVTEAVARAMFPHYFTDDRQPLRVFTETRSDTELREAERESARHRARQALAVVREHLPFRLDPKEK